MGLFEYFKNIKEERIKREKEKRKKKEERKYELWKVQQQREKNEEERQKKERKETIKKEKPEKEKWFNLLEEDREFLNSNIDIINYILGADGPRKIDRSIEFLDGLKKLHLEERDLKTTEINVLTITGILSLRKTTLNDFGNDIGTKIIKKRVFKGMSEKMFLESLKHFVIESYNDELILGADSNGQKYLQKSNTNDKNMVVWKWRGDIILLPWKATTLTTDLIFENDNLINI